jgi:hypothetical protein
MAFTCNQVRSHAITCIHMFAVRRLEVDKALAGLRNRMLGRVSTASLHDDDDIWTA